MAMRFRGRRTMRRRAKKRFIWTGFQYGDNSAPIGGIPDVAEDPLTHFTFVIAGPASTQTPLTTATDLIVQRVLLAFAVSNDTLVDSLLNMSIEVAHTDLDEIPMTTPPNWSDWDALQKREPMWMGSWFVPAGSAVGTGPGANAEAFAINNGLPIEIKSKRRLTGDDSLVLKVSGLSAVGEVTSALFMKHLWCRALISGGRR